jgi:hypothetical protein
MVLELKVLSSNFDSLIYLLFQLTIKSVESTQFFLYQVIESHIDYTFIVL